MSLLFNVGFLVVSVINDFCNSCLWWSGHAWHTEE